MDRLYGRCNRNSISPYTFCMRHTKLSDANRNKERKREKSRPLYSDKYIDPQFNQKAREEKAFQKGMGIYNMNPTV